MTSAPNETMATAAAALTAIRVFFETIVNMTLSFPFLRFGPGPLPVPMY
ncbi:MAG TPA: hypothetical protein VFM30_06475 [Steroidobacteraceae bacterium]|nr:hypothetical protein [Steroidobacteraceae bacterium]